MTKTEINIGEEIINFFNTAKPVTRPPDRNKLLHELWQPVLANFDTREKVKIFHCFSAYEKAYIEFEWNNINIGQNCLDYAEYHSFEIEGVSKILLNVLHQQALALKHSQEGQYPEALEKLKEGENGLKEIQRILNINYLQTIQEYLLVNVLYALGDYETASEHAFRLIKFWTTGKTIEENQIIFSESTEAQRQQVIHYLTNGFLLCIHNSFGENQDLLQVHLEKIFKPDKKTSLLTCPVEGYEKAVQLLFPYNNIDNLNTYVPELVELFPQLSGIPAFIQYYLLKKLIRIMEFIDYPEAFAIANELKRYFKHIGVGKPNNLKKDKAGFIEEQS